MPNVDQFESVFRSADKEIFAYERPSFSSVLVITDRDEYEANLFADHVRQFLTVVDDEAPAWVVVTGAEYETVKDLLDLVEQHGPDLVVTYRHLKSEAWRWPFTLGDHVEVLTQATTTPVLIVPHPEAGRAAPHALQNTNVVMAITDHLTGDHCLVNYAARFTERGGTLYLTHVEDELAFRRAIDAISKIPELDTDVARTAIPRQLLKEPTDYIASAREVLELERTSLTVEPVVTMGHRLGEYKKLVSEREVDLLVLHTKDEDQLAMHGLAYPLAVELRSIALLML